MSPIKTAPTLITTFIFLLAVVFTASIPSSFAHKGPVPSPVGISDQVPEISFKGEKRGSKESEKIDDTAVFLSGVPLIVVGPDIVGSDFDEELLTKLDAEVELSTGGSVKWLKQNGNLGSNAYSLRYHFPSKSTGSVAQAIFTLVGDTFSLPSNYVIALKHFASGPEKATVRFTDLNGNNAEYVLTLEREFKNFTLDLDDPLYAEAGFDRSKVAAIVIEANQSLTTKPEGQIDFILKKGIESTFNADTEGWAAIGAAVSHESAGGNPGGFLKIQDTDGSTFETYPPSKFKGNLLAYDGGFLTYDLIVLSAPTLPLASVGSGLGRIQLHGGGSNATFDYAPNPPIPSAGYWTTYTVPLTAEAWNTTQANWETVLSDITIFHIILEPVNGSSVGLDNFTIVPAPE